MRLIAEQNIRVTLCIFALTDWLYINDPAVGKPINSSWLQLQLCICFLVLIYGASVSKSIQHWFMVRISHSENELQQLIFFVSLTKSLYWKAAQHAAAINHNLTPETFNLLMDFKWRMWSLFRPIFLQYRTKNSAARCVCFLDFYLCFSFEIRYSFTSLDN